MRIRPIHFILWLALLQTSCGGGNVEIDAGDYTPKIVVEGFLTPGQPVKNIRITRNFWVDQDISHFSLLLPDANVRLTDLQSNRPFPLVFNDDVDMFEYTGVDLQIQPESEYRLEITAQIDGQRLQTQTTTRTPGLGFRVAGQNYERLMYREREENGQLTHFKFMIERSPGTSFYAVSMTSLAADSIQLKSGNTAQIEADLQRIFIFDNAFFDLEMADLVDDLDDYRYRSTWIQDTPVTPGQSTIDVFWFDTWFYGAYRVIIYAADDNYKQFLQTYKDVQEPDGNFHEPAFSFDGDGIGVFGAVIADTAYFEVLRPTF